MQAMKVAILCCVAGSVFFMYTVGSSSMRSVNSVLLDLACFGLSEFIEESSVLAVGGCALDRDGGGSLSLNSSKSNVKDECDSFSWASFALGSSLGACVDSFKSSTELLDSLEG